MYSSAYPRGIPVKYIETVYLTNQRKLNATNQQWDKERRKGKIKKKKSFDINLANETFNHETCEGSG